MTDVKTRFAVGGASGLVGEALSRELGRLGHQVVRLVRSTPRSANEARWSPDEGVLDPKDLAGVDVVVNLAGENVAGGRWTDDRKRKILESRVRSTSLLARTIATMERKPVFVSASAIGFYGDRGEEELDESAPGGDGFLADVCRAWEGATTAAEQAGARTVHTRFGMIVAREGGALAKMRGPFSLGLGGPIGSGRQWVSLVDLADAVGAILTAAGDPRVRGPLNVVCPAPIRQGDFAKALGHALHRPAVMPLPAFAVKAGMGQMGAEMLLASQRVLPRGLLQAGYTFARPDAASSLAAQLAG